MIEEIVFNEFLVRVSSYKLEYFGEYRLFFLYLNEIEYINSGEKLTDDQMFQIYLKLKENKNLKFFNEFNPFNIKLHVPLVLGIIEIENIVDRIQCIIKETLIKEL